MDISMIEKIGNIFGVGLLSGTNIFITIATIGGIEYWLHKPIPGLEGLANPVVILIAASIYFLETSISFIYNIFTPSIPIDTVKETIKSLLIIPATAVMVVLIGTAESGEQLTYMVAMGANVGPMAVFYFFVGGFLASITQSIKISIRAIIDLLPEPFTNLLAEIIEGSICLVGLGILLVAPYGKEIIFISSIILIIFFLIFGPRIFRSVRINYKALYAGLKYIGEGRRSVPFNPRYLNNKIVKKIQKKAPIKEAETVIRVIVAKAKGIGANRIGYLFLQQGNLYIACPGLFRVKVKSYPVSAVEKAELKSRLLFNYVDLIIPGEKRIRLKFFKTWRADAELLCAKFKPEPKVCETLVEATN